MVPILFESDDLVVVDKPEGLATIPGRGMGKETLLSLVQRRYRRRLYVVHRLDRGTSGVVVFAKTAEAHQFLSEQFELREVHKTYLALVHGIVADDQGVIDKPIRQFGSGRMGIDTQGGKPSVTDFSVVTRFEHHTLIEAHPQTGRRHQIRVHLYSLGHPIAGDPLYGARRAQTGFARMMLHAHKLSLRVPTSEQITLEAPVPESFTQIVRTLTREMS